MVIAVWCLAALFWVTIIVKHLWMKDEIRAKRTRAWDYPTLEKLARIIHWVFKPLEKRAVKKLYDSLSPEEKARDVEMWLASEGIRSQVVVNPDNVQGYDILIHQDDKEILTKLFNELGFPLTEKRIGDLIPDSHSQRTTASPPHVDAAKK